MPATDSMEHVDSGEHGPLTSRAVYPRSEIARIIPITRPAMTAIACERDGGSYAAAVDGGLAAS